MHTLAALICVLGLGLGLGLAIHTVLAERRRQRDRARRAHARMVAYIPPEGDNPAMAGLIDVLRKDRAGR